VCFCHLLRQLYSELRRETGTPYTAYNIYLLVSKGPIGLRRGSAADLLLGFRFRISPGRRFVTYVSVMCDQALVFEKDRSLVQRSPNDCGVLFCVIWKPKMRRL
jgi:hypothetical protein